MDAVAHVLREPDRSVSVWDSVMLHGLGKGPPVRGFAEEEEGGAAIEMALMLGLAAFFAFVMKNVVAAPLLATLTKASQVLSQALGGMGAV
jgi:Flp pilus assembly pilin Flp